MAPNWRTMSISQYGLPVAGSRHETSHFGPMATTYLSVTAGTVRDMPWFRFTPTG